MDPPIPTLPHISPLRLWLLGALVLALTLPLYLTGEWVIAQRHTHDNLSLAAWQEQTLALLAAALVPPLQQQQLENAHRMVAPLLALPRVASVRVVDTRSGQALLHFDFPERNQGPVWWRALPITHEGVDIGLVELRLNPGEAAEERDAARRTLWQLLLLQLLAGALLVIPPLQWFLFRRLRRLRQQMTALARGETCLTFPWKEQDELGDMGRTLQNTCGVLAVQTERMEEQNRQLVQDVQRLRQEQEQLRLSLDGANLAPWDWFIDLGQVRFSERLIRMQGFDPATFPQDMTFYRSLIHEDDRRRVDQALEAHLTGGATDYNVEFRFRCRDGSFRWINALARVVTRTPGGAPVRMTGIHQDITEKRAVVEQLLRSDKMAALGQLVAGVAHELNTPLGAIKSASEHTGEHLRQVFARWPHLLEQLMPQHRVLLLDMVEQSLTHVEHRTHREMRADRKRLEARLESQEITLSNRRNFADWLVQLGMDRNPEAWIPLAQLPLAQSLFETALAMVSAVRSIQIIRQSAARAARIVQALRRHARQEHGGQFEAVVLKDSLESVLTLFQSAMKQGVVLQMGLPEDLPPVNANPDQLGQVWSNLIQNALQAMNHEGRLEITLREEGGGQQVAITDSGHGIAPENLERIFLPFYTTKPGGEGTGLGLDIVRRIVQDHGGRITVTSTPGQGSRFAVWLPAARSTTEAHPGGAPAPETPPPARPLVETP
ncbi:MAG: ATP-binding protein [Magnetococcus sp. WYHC-3]